MPPSWAIEEGAFFLKDLERLAKSLYKANAQRKAFASYIKDLRREWEENGLPPRAHTMSGFSLPDGWSLRKVDLRPPGTRGQSGEMRVLALVSEKERRIILLMAYTHAEYPKQPGPREIQGRIANL